MQESDTIEFNSSSVRMQTMMESLNLNTLNDELDGEELIYSPKRYVMKTKNSSRQDSSRKQGRTERVQRKNKQMKVIYMTLDHRSGRIPTESSPRKELSRY